MFRAFQLSLFAPFGNFLIGCSSESNHPHSPESMPSQVGSDSMPPDASPSNLNCSSWAKFSDKKTNITKAGLYCQKDNITYKCKDSVTGITMVPCPENMNRRALQILPPTSLTHPHLRAMKDSDSDSTEDDAEWKELDQQIKKCPKWIPFPSNNMSVGGLYCQQNGQNYKCSENPLTGSSISVGSCPDNMNKRVLDDNQLKNCPKWIPYPSGNISGGGLYCQKKNEIYKCSENPLTGNDISLFGCPDNMNKRVLDDSLDRQIDQQKKEIDRMLEEITQQIENCPKWILIPSKTISAGGLYCQNFKKNDGQNYKCSENPLTGNGISIGSCPGTNDDKSDESQTEIDSDESKTENDSNNQTENDSSDGSDSSHFFDQIAVQEIKNCPGWKSWPSSTFDRVGLFCQSGEEFFKCSQTPESGSFTFGDCERDMKVDKATLLII